MGFKERYFAYLANRVVVNCGDLQISQEIIPDIVKSLSLYNMNIEDAVDYTIDGNKITYYFILDELILLLERKFRGYIIPLDCEFAIDKEFVSKANKSILDYNKNGGNTLFSEGDKVTILSCCVNDACSTIDYDLQVYVYNGVETSIDLNMPSEIGGEDA